MRTLGWFILLLSGSILVAGWLLSSIAFTQSTYCNSQNPQLNWGNPNPLEGNVNTPDCSEKSPDERDNGLQLYIHRQQCDTLQEGIWISRRDSHALPWNTPTPVFDNTNPANPVIIYGGQPSISSDGNYLYYALQENGVCGLNFNIHYAVRDPNYLPELDRWLPQGPVPGPINTNNHDEQGPSISSDGYVLYFCRMAIESEFCIQPPGDHDIYRVWGGITPYLAFPLIYKEEILSIPSFNEMAPDISSDYSLIVFNRKEITNPNHDGVYIAARDTSFPLVFPPRWCTPKKIQCASDPICTDDPSAEDKSPCISAGNMRILFRSRRNEPNKSDIYIIRKL